MHTIRSLVGVISCRHSWLSPFLATTTEWWPSDDAIHAIKCTLHRFDGFSTINRKADASMDQTRTNRISLVSCISLSTKP